MSTRGTAHRLASEVAQVADFSRIRYSQGWEDPRCLERALRITDQSVVLSIAAAGDNSFALLLMGEQGPHRVVSVDMNPAQCALVELKRAAIRTLDYDTLLRFLGVTPSVGTRSSLYTIVRSELPDPARTFWDAHPELITAGIIHVGRLESFFRTFRTVVLPVLHRRRTVDQLLMTRRDPAERAIFWDEQFAHRRWNAVMRGFCSPTVVGRLGRDPAFFAHVDMPNVGEHYLERVRHASAVLDPFSNPYLHYIFRGNYTPGQAMPDYLTEATITTLRTRLDRLDVVCGELESTLESYDGSPFDACNLSDIFEWMSPSLYLQMLTALLRVTSPGARLAYWNNLVIRSRPAELADRLHEHTELAADIHHADRSFMYRAFRVEEVVAA